MATRDLGAWGGASVARTAELVTRSQRRRARASAPALTAAALHPTLFRTGKLQRDESVIHVLGERLDDPSPRLRTLRDCTGDTESGSASKPLFASAVKPPGYDPREIAIASRDFRWGRTRRALVSLLTLNPAVNCRRGGHLRLGLQP